MSTLLEDTPTKRAALVGGISAYLAYLVHGALLNSPLALRADAGAPPDGAVVALALTGLGVAAAVLAEAKRRHDTVGGTGRARLPHTWWSFALACTLPIAQVDGTPLPALLVAALGVVNGAWWTCAFGVLAVGVAAATTRAPSAWITRTFPSKAWGWCHGVCAWGGWGTAALVAFPVLPTLTLF
jgi:hypothetical protein